MFIFPFSCPAHHISTTQISEIVGERRKSLDNVVHIRNVFFPFYLFAFPRGKLSEVYGWRLEQALWHKGIIPVLVSENTLRTTPYH